MQDDSSSRHRSQSAGADSIRTDTTWRYSVFGPERMGKGAMLFTGPDGIRDHRVSVEPEHRYVGEGTMSPEGTSDVDYLWRAPLNMPHPRPKSKCVGEIGWGIPAKMDWSATRTGAQTKLGEFRQAVEDRHTHLFQNAWYPGPGEVLRRESDAALVMNVYKTKPDTASSSRPGTSHSRYTGSESHSNYQSGSNNNNNNNSNRFSRYSSIPSYGYW